MSSRKVTGLSQKYECHVFYSFIASEPLLSHNASVMLSCRYVVSSLEMLVAEDYLIIYMNGATPRSKMPGISWLKKCYQMIDRRWEMEKLWRNCSYILIDVLCIK